MSHTDIVKTTKSGQSNRIIGSFTSIGLSEITLISGDFTFSIQNLGTAGSVTIQRSHDDGATWKNVKTYLEDIEDNGTEPGKGRLADGRMVKMSYRINCEVIDASGEIFYVLGG